MKNDRRLYACSLLLGFAAPRPASEQWHRLPFSKVGRRCDTAT